MSKVDMAVGLDDELVRGVDELAARLGVTRGDVIEESVRRTLAARTLGDVLARVRTSSPLTEQQAEDLAYEEVKAARAERRARRAP